MGGSAGGFGGPLTPQRAALLSAGASMMGARDPWRGAGRGLQAGLGTYLSMRQAQLEEKIAQAERKRAEQTLEATRKKAQLEEQHKQAQIAKLQAEAAEPPPIRNLPFGKETVAARRDRETGQMVPVEIAGLGVARGERRAPVEISMGTELTTGAKTELQKRKSNLASLKQSAQRLAKLPSEELKLGVGVFGALRATIGGLAQAVAENIPALSAVGEISDWAQSDQAKVIRGEIQNVINQAAFLADTGKLSDDDVQRARALADGLNWATSTSQYAAQLDELLSLVGEFEKTIEKELGAPGSATTRGAQGTSQDPSYLIKKYGLEP